MIAAALAVLGGCALAGYLSIGRFEAHARLVEQTHRVRLEIEELKSLFVRARLFWRLYLVSGAEENLHQFESLAAQLPRQLDEIGRLIANGPAQRQRLRELAGIINRDLQDLDARASIRRGGTTADAGALLERLGSTGPAVSEVIRLTGEMDAEEQRLLAGRAAEAARSTQLSRIAIVAGSALALIVLLAAFVRLWREVGERQRAEHEAARRADELEAFSYTVSHDLRAPLRAVDGYSQMLQEDYGPRLDEEGRRLLGVVREESARMGQLIDDLLRLSQVGRKPLARQVVDMRALAAEVVAELAPGHPAAAVGLADLPPAAGDRALLRQVWINLVDNALKYSALGASPRVEIAGNVEGASVVYVVQDNGAGFDMRYQDKLFKAFQRLHRQEEFPGTGIGLAIVERVVARHGGRVWAQSAPGAGAAFHFSLPREG